MACKPSLLWQTFALVAAANFEIQANVRPLNISKQGSEIGVKGTPIFGTRFLEGSQAPQSQMYKRFTFRNEAPTRGLFLNPPPERNTSKRHIRNAAAAMHAYAKQAKSRGLEADAAEIRFRAERKLGLIIQAQKESVGLNQGTKNQLSGGVKNTPPEDAPITLDEIGIDKNLAKRARKSAAPDDSEFEALVSDWRDRISGDGRVTLNLFDAGKRVAAGDDDILTAAIW